MWKLLLIMMLSLHFAEKRSSAYIWERTKNTGLDPWARKWKQSWNGFSTFVCEVHVKYVKCSPFRAFSKRAKVWWQSKKQAKGKKTVVTSQGIALSTKVIRIRLPTSITYVNIVVSMFQTQLNFPPVQILLTTTKFDFLEYGMKISLNLLTLFSNTLKLSWGV